MRRAFDKSVCCVLSRNLCKEGNLYDIFVGFNVCVAFVGLILLLQSVFQESLFYIGLGLYGGASLIELVLSTFPFRYLGSFDTQRECCNGYLWKVVMSVAIGVTGISASFIELGSMHNVTDAATLNAIIFFAVSVVSMYWSLAFKPRCCKMEQNYDEDFPMYIESAQGMDATSAFACVFLISWIMMNASVSVYWNDEMLHATSLVLSGAGIVSSLAFQASFSCLYRVNGIDRDTTVGGCWWICVVSCTAASSIGTAFHAIFDLTTPDTSYPIQWATMRWYWIVQGVYPGLILLVLLCWGIGWCFYACCTCCRQTLATELNKARQSVEELNRAMQSVADETTPLTRNADGCKGGEDDDKKKQMMMIN